MTRSCGIFASRLSSSSEMPSEKYSCSLSDAHVHERQHGDGAIGRGGDFGGRWWRPNRSRLIRALVVPERPPPSSRSRVRIANSGVVMRC